MSSSTDVSPVVPAATAFRSRDLRVGHWTRLGPDSALGDAVSERTLTDVAEQARSAAQAQGYSVGWAQGRREAAAEAAEAAEATAARAAEAEARREAEHRTAVQALRAAAAELHATLDEVTARVEARATDLAWALTEELVGHRVRHAGADEVVRRVLALAPAGEVARVSMHPDHVAAAAAALEEQGVRCVADASLGPLDAVVELNDHALDLRIDTAMARVREVLA